MAYNRLPLRDPRTVAREIPGIFEAIFPQLTASVVVYFNKKRRAHPDLDRIPDDLVGRSSTPRAMLFEIGYVRGEQLLLGQNTDWDACIKIASERQQKHFDAQIPNTFNETDFTIADLIGHNLLKMINGISSKTQKDLVIAPEISGFQWIASGVGDFSIDDKLVEVKCNGRLFGSADYRQILMYWLLSYSAAIENDSPEWKTAVLMNPRLNRIVEIPFDEIIQVTAAGKSKVEILELFSSIVGDYALKALPEFKF